MDLVTATLLAATGFAGGIVTVIVGGSSLICFPVMLAAGLPPIVANASTTVAMTPGALAGAFADPERLPNWDRAFAGLALIALGGSALGAVLLLVLPEATFVALIPVLIGTATLLFAFAERVRSFLVRRMAVGRRDHAAILQPVLFAPVAVYGGYFGAGMSVMTLAILSIGKVSDYRSINSVKNLLGVLASAVAIAIFIVHGVVAWPATLAMMSGALVGGYAGGRLVRVLPAQLIRAIVVTVGTVLTMVYGWRYWGG